MNLISLSSEILSLVLHFLAFGVIFYILQPVFGWYLSKIPILGVDFYNSVTYVNYLTKNFALQFAGFKDIWFGGYPLWRDFISAQYYPMILFAKYFDLIRGIQYYVLTSLFLLGVFSYLLYHQLTKSRVFSLLLTLFVLYSVNIYGAATWGGSLPYFTSQFFLPLTLLLILKYTRSANIRWFLAAILTTGLGFLSHPLLIFGFIIPPAVILIFFGRPKTEAKFLKDLLARIYYVFLFIAGSLVVAFPVSFERIIFLIKAFLLSGPGAFFGFTRSTPATPAAPSADLTQSQAGTEIIQFYQGLPRLLYFDTNIWLFALAGVGIGLFVITFIMRRKLGILFRVLPFVLIAGYTALHPVLNAQGFSFIAQGWYRAFWPFPVMLAAVTASFWGEFFEFVREKFRVNKLALNIIVSNLPFALLGLIFIFIGYLFFTIKTQEVVTSIDSKIEYSSAHPEALSIRISPSELAELKKQLAPSFINPNDKNKRLYEADALVNIWWNALYDMPLVRGYIDPPIATSERGGFFWLDIAATNDTLERDFKIPRDIAYNNALFLIDWYGVYYFEGGRTGLGPNPPPSSYLLENNVFDKTEKTVGYGAILKWLTESGKPELHLEVPQYLNFYKVRNDLTSPVLYSTNAPAILVFADLPGYEDFLRAIATVNINSQYLIPVRAGKYIDDLKQEDFKNFDAVILHNYSYHNQKKAFELLSEFTKKGGKVFIETGAEAKDSVSGKLPDLFPISSSIREGLGKSWDFEAKPDSITEGVDFSQFGPPIFQDSEWKLSFPKNGIRNGAEVILKHQGKPLLVKQQYGQGQVIWSGLNLLYHFNQYKVADEAKLFVNILKQLVEIQKHEVVPADTSWKKPEKVTINTQSGARGILFKEQNYPGWTTKSNGKTLPIYKTGPTFPGFMYVPVGENKPFKLEFSYSGELKAFLIHGVSAVFIIYLLDSILLNGLLFGRRLNLLYQLFRKRIGSWWEREEE